ncbi:hypothetical protein ACKFRZ_07815 [Corynebacterium gottingense]|uniref:hypothetical protein n=1 Tax=Corynebacterium gottingense TaxID=2041036 RepID=UPI0038D1468A
MLNFTSKTHTAPAQPSDYCAPLPTEYAAHIRERETDTLQQLTAMIHHPRSLARPTARWRPPTKRLPRLGHTTDLTIAISRRRVGPRAQARVRGYGEDRVPAFLIEVRVTDPSGLPTDRRVAEGWVRALLPIDAAGAVHELPSPRAASYVWLTDGDFVPVLSPSSMFEGLAAA